MGHLRYGPLNLGHGELEAVADPTKRASPQVERTLRTTPLTMPAATAADVADVAGGEATSPIAVTRGAQEATLALSDVGGTVASGTADAGGSVPRQFDEKKGGGFADVSADVAGDVANEATRQVNLAVKTAGEAAGDLSTGLPSMSNLALFGVVAAVLIVAANAFAGEAAEGLTD